MPLYDARWNATKLEPGDKALPGSVPFPTPCRILDANGKQILFLLTANTETGEVERYDCFPDGRRFAIDPETKRVAVLKETHPAPLQVVLLKLGEPYIAPETVVPKEEEEEAGRQGAKHLRRLWFAKHGADDDDDDDSDDGDAPIIVGE